MKKTNCYQPEVTFQEILNARKLVVGRASFFSSFCTENREEQLKKSTHKCWALNTIQSRSTRSQSDRRVCLWWITWIKIAHLTSATWRVRQREIFQLNRIWDQREMSSTFSLETSLKFNLRKWYQYYGDNF